MANGFGSHSGHSGHSSQGHEDESSTDDDDMMGMSPDPPSELLHHMQQQQAAAGFGHSSFQHGFGQGLPISSMHPWASVAQANH
jgi:hypothetical protein